MKLLPFISKKKTGNVLAISVVALFLILGLLRLYPYVNELHEGLATDPGDDWWTYAGMGLDIVRNGILLPRVQGPYSNPAGFLYNYFIALSFLIFGENLIPIYIIQHLLMGLSVALLYWTFRDKMRPFTGTLFLSALTLFTLLDVYKNYAIRLLSENLMFFTIALFFFCFVKGFEKNRPGLQLFSAFLMGTIVLTRPEMLLFALVLILIVASIYIKRRLKGVVYLFLFIIIMGLAISPLGIRNYLVTGKWSFLPVQKIRSSGAAIMPGGCQIPSHVDFGKVPPSPLYTKLHIPIGLVHYMEYIRRAPSVFLEYYSKKVLFCFGFLTILDPNFRWRPHWMLMWIGYLTYLVLWIKDRRRLKLWEVTVHLYLLSYIGVSIMFTNIQNYGFRRLICAVNFVLIFFFLALDRLSAGRINPRGEKV